jgi:hypothetical protein
MPTLIAQPTSIQAAGNKPKLIDEYNWARQLQNIWESVRAQPIPAGCERLLHADLPKSPYVTECFSFSTFSR